MPCAAVRGHFRSPDGFIIIYTKEFSMPIFPLSTRNLALVLAGGLLGSAAALAASTGPMAEAQMRYRQEMADCKSGKTHQDMATCHAEARNALAEAKRKGLNDDASQYQQNMLDRCKVHEGIDRSACEARMRGEGTVEGSVEGGGILRESVTTIPGE